MFKPRFLKKSRIATELLLWFLTISLLPLAVVSMFIFEKSQHSLEQEVMQGLSSVAQRQSKQILTYIRERERNVTTLSRAPGVVRAIKEFGLAFLESGLDTPSYDGVDAKFRWFLTYYQESFEYEDLYLFTADGFAIFSVGRGEDLGSNFISGIYRSTGLAKVFSRATTLLETGISDFAYYPVTNEPAAFIAAPVFERGSVIGVVALQMNNDAIYKIVNDYTGLGRTGETVIASKSVSGDAAVFQAPTRHDPYAAFRKRISLDSKSGEGAIHAVNGMRSRGVITDYRGRKALAVWRYTPDLRWGMVTKIDAKEAFAPIVHLRRLSLLIAALTLVMVVVSTVFVARSLANPIRNLTRRTRLVAAGDLDQTIEIETKNEIGDLAQSFNEMITGLRERDLIKDTFGKYLSPHIRDEVLSGRIPLDGEIRDVTVMFIDLRKFTALPERMAHDPKLITKLLNHFFTAMTDRIVECGGTVGKYIGDSVMAFWNAPEDDPDHVRHACLGALELLDGLGKLNRKLRVDPAFADGPPITLDIGVGLNSGECLVGNMGSEHRLTYSIVGDACNLASRLEGQSKTYGMPIIMGENAATAAADFAVLELDLTQVIGKSGAERIYALLSDEKTANTFQPLIDAQAEMLAAYRAQDWTVAAALVAKCRGLKGAVDRLYDEFAARIEAYRDAPPGADWDGVHVATSK